MELYGFMEREKKIPSYFFIITLILCIAGHIADVVIENVVHYAQTIS